MLHGTRENEIDNLLRQGKLVDLYRIVREAVRVSEPSYSIKNLEAFYMPRREGDVKTAAASVVMYEQWRRLGEVRLLQEIADYNEVDCRSALLLRRWLLSLRPVGITWYDGAVGERPDPEREARRLEAEQRAIDTVARLLAAPAGELPFRELVGHLLEFHRREAKPEWWAMFILGGFPPIEQLLALEGCLTVASEFSAGRLQDRRRFVLIHFDLAVLCSSVVDRSWSTALC
jgi:RNase_H superfamily